MAESVVELGATQLYDLFGTPGTGSWLFDARCASMAVGTPVRIRLPFDNAADRHPAEIFGKLSAVRPGSMIVIEHCQPWRGQLRMNLDPAGPRRTRVRIRANVSTEGVDWLVRRRGLSLPLPPPAANTVRIGVVASKSGPGAVYSTATEYLAELAVDEVNNSGGLGGRRLELIVADDATDPSFAASEARRLVRAGCRAIFACTTSISFAAMEKAIRTGDVLLVHSVMNERASRSSPTVIRFGERPADQIDALAGRLMQATGARNWFLVGLEYSWSYGAHFAARRAVSRGGGRVVGEAYTPLGTTDYSQVIERIEQSGADIVMSSLNGSHEVDFQQQSLDAGLRSSARNVSLVMDESTCEHIGPAAAEGIWTALGYLQGGPAPGNSDLVARYRSAYGRWAPPISTLSETVYETIHRYAQAVHRHADDAPHQQRRALLEHRTQVGATSIGSRDILVPRLYLTEVRGGELQVFDKTG